jgi:signal transduction histidine kinase
MSTKVWGPVSFGPMSSIDRSRSSSTANLSSPFHITILACLVAIMSYLAARVGTTVVIRPHLDWPLWPGNILLASVLLLAPRRAWPLLIAAALATFAVYDLRIGISIRSVIFFQLSDATEVLTAALGLGYCFEGVPQLNSVKALAKYSFFAVLLAPFAGAFFSAFTTQGEYWRSWSIAFLAQALGYLTLMPAILGWVSNRSEWAPAPRSRYFEALALLAGLLVLGYLSLASPSTMVAPVLTIVPFLLWAALRFGTTGVSSLAIAVAFLAIWGAVHGRGPFVAQGPAHDVPSIQVFLLLVAAPFMVLAVVVEERKNAEHALASVNRKLIEAQEKERSRIARELHDDLGQRLALLANEMEQLQQYPDLRDEVSSSIRELQNRLFQIAADVQSLSHALHSSKLEYLGIEAAMRGFCQEFGRQQKAEIDFKSQDVPSPLPPEISLCLFRVAQEALHNSAKHSGIRHFEVRLWAEHGAVHLTVQDSGSGFDWEAAKQGRGLGLTSMEERIKLVNGTLSIASQPRRGTSIHARVPLGSGNDTLRAVG